MPQMRYHLSGQARVHLDGRDYYLGTHGSVEVDAAIRHRRSRKSSVAVLRGQHKKPGMSRKKGVQVNLSQICSVRYSTRLSRHAFSTRMQIGA